jgi:hypothetical protein
MMGSILADSQGIVHGDNTAADLFFLIATIVFAIAFVIRLTIRPIPIDGLVVAAGLTAVALGLLLL